MNIKNTFLVCINNFLLVFKQLVYTLLIGVVVGLCLYGVASPIAKLLQTSGWMGELKDFVSSIYTEPKEIAVAFNGLAESLFMIFTQNFSKLWGNYILSSCLIVFVPIFASNLSYYCLGDVVNAKMNSWMNYGYANRFFSGIKKNIIYSLYMVVFGILSGAIIVGLFMLYGIIANSFLLMTILLPVLILSIIIVLAIRNSFTMWIMPACLNEDIGVTKAVKKSFKLGAKNFGRVFLASALIYLLEFFFVMVGGVFTLGAGLCIVIPAVTVLNAIFSLINYYQIEKLRYYINEFTIVSPND